MYTASWSTSDGGGGPERTDIYTHGFNATCHLHTITQFDTWCAVDAHEANKGKATVPEGVQDNVLNLQVVQEVLAQLGDRQPFLLTLPS
jgi:predicted esterase YcpF (UPF0227 family)